MTEDVFLHAIHAEPGDDMHRLAYADWLEERGIAPDMILIGEPTSEHRLGDTIKIGRRGSVNMWITVPGTQGSRRRDDADRCEESEDEEPPTDAD